MNLSAETHTETARPISFAAALTGFLASTTILSGVMLLFSAV